MTILNEYEKIYSNPYVEIIFICFIITLIIVFAAMAIGNSEIADKLFDVIFILCILFCIVVFILRLWKSDIVCVKNKRIEVTFDNNTIPVDIFDEYNIVEQRNKIFVLEKKKQ